MDGTLDSSITDTIINNPKMGAAVTATSLDAIDKNHVDKAAENDQRN